MDGGHLIEGAIFIKIDSGPGRNYKSKFAIEFCHDMCNEGVHMVSAYQTPLALFKRWMTDDWFQKFNGMMDLQVQDIFEQKTYNYALLFKNHNKECVTKIKSASLSNDIYSTIINGQWPNDQPEKHPFDWCATPKKLSKVG